MDNSYVENAVSPEVPALCGDCSSHVPRPYVVYILWPQLCMLYQNKGGGFNQTANGKWPHLLYTIWASETRDANEVFMEAVPGYVKINKQRRKLVSLKISGDCSLSLTFLNAETHPLWDEEACIQRSKTACFLAFHTTCTKRVSLNVCGVEPVTLTFYCKRHLPLCIPCTYLP